MLAFDLPRPVDFAYVCLGSLFVREKAQMDSHFDSVSRVLAVGGLYLLDCCIQFTPSMDHHESWRSEQDGIEVKAEFCAKCVNKVAQTFEQTIVLDVDDHGRSSRLSDAVVLKAIYPQEFLLYISGRNDFEFVGWWNEWDLDRPILGEEPVNRPIAVVRRI
jgi:hypothetical protein